MSSRVGQLFERDCLNHVQTFEGEVRVHVLGVVDKLIHVTFVRYSSRVRLQFYGPKYLIPT